MTVKQISVFIENKAGTLAEITSIIAKNDIDIRAITVADTTRFGIMRMVVDKPEECERVLKEEGYTVSLTKVLAAGVDDRPGGLASVLALLRDGGISVEYIYAFISQSTSNAYVILMINDIVAGEKILSENGVTLFDAKTISDL
jgi:hypothetical protein